MNYCCPICHQKLSLEGKSLICPQRHCFDIAKSGYVNMLTGKSSSKSHGDNKEMVAARSRFLESGAYRCLVDGVIPILNQRTPRVLVDAGCGEGYYTRQIKQALSAAEVYGFDLSKDAIRYASQHDKESHYAISSIFSLPLFDQSVDFVTSLFAPLALEEFNRILCPQGFLLIVTPGADHLFELKKQVYDRPYRNEPTEISDERFETVLHQTITDEITLNTTAEIQSLFAMTPYFYKTAWQDKNKLAALSSLTTTVEFSLQLLKKR